MRCILCAADVRAVKRLRIIRNKDYDYDGIMMMIERASADALMDIVMKGAEEVVTVEDLRNALTTGDELSVYAGYEPSGSVHLGHLLTLHKLKEMQDAGFRVIVLLADLHAYLNEKGDFDEINKIAEYNRRCFIATGLDKAEFILGSSFQLGHEYMLNVLKLAAMTSLQRARRSMDEISRSKENPKVSQMIYPLMQAVDIAFLGVDIAVGGTDQRKIHMLSREYLPKLGFKAPVCVHMPIILGLDGTKMSSSKGNFIALDDDENEIRRKIRNAFCPPRSTADENPILQIYKNVIFQHFEEITIERDAKYGGDLTYKRYEDVEYDYVNGNLHPLDLKMNASRYLNSILEPIRRRLR